MTLSMPITDDVCGSLGMTSVTGTGDGHPHFLLTDWQGNFIGVHDKAGKIGIKCVVRVRYMEKVV